MKHGIVILLEILALLVLLFVLTRIDITALSIWFSNFVGDLFTVLGQ